MAASFAAEAEKEVARAASLALDAEKEAARLQAKIAAVSVAAEPVAMPVREA